MSPYYCTITVHFHCLVQSLQLILPTNHDFFLAMFSHFSRISHYMPPIITQIKMATFIIINLSLLLEVTSENVETIIYCNIHCGSGGVMSSILPL